jgi:two-component system OmpR family sensor kinase
MARPWPLRTRLIAGVLALLAGCLIAISVISYIGLRQYLVGRIDLELISTARKPTILTQRDLPTASSFVLPTNWLVAVKTANGMGPVFPDLPAQTQPTWPHSATEVATLPRTPYTARAPDGTEWRLLALYNQEGQLMFLGQSLTDVQGAIHRFLVIELIVGGATLLIVSAIGAEVIRRSLRPLSEIETKAAAITAGDLTQRVPEYEPDSDVPKTEVGTLGRTLNTMLNEIEVAFQARAESEARARNAASAAHQSEIRARRSEERMRQFAADASHELRTPLTTIRGFAELYRHGAAREPQETQRLLRRIEDEAQRMGMLVDDLLLLARLDQERPLEQVPVDLRVVAADAVAAAHVVAPARPVTLEIAAGTGGLIVTGDELRIRQVVSNLMTNALTYTPPATPVALRLSADVRPDGGIARIDVVDHGPGLSEGHMAHAFERFYRGDTARTRGVEGGHSSGTGLGLAIVAALVKAHGGTVDVARTPGGGATFQVQLPLERRDDLRYETADDDGSGTPSVPDDASANGTHPATPPDHDGAHHDGAEDGADHDDADHDCAGHLSRSGRPEKYR